MANFTAGTSLAAASLNSALNQITINPQTASYTLVTNDQGGMITVNSTSATNVTLPPNSTVPLAVGTTLIVAQLNTGQVTFVAGAGVTINGTPGVKLRTRYSAATCVKVSADNWLIMGDLSA